MNIHQVILMKSKKNHNATQWKISAFKGGKNHADQIEEGLWDQAVSEMYAEAEDGGRQAMAPGRKRSEDWRVTENRGPAKGAAKNPLWLQ